jgi:hypothetical protein
MLNKAYGSFGSISFTAVNFEKSFNRTKKLVGTLQYNKYLNQACRQVKRLGVSHPPLWHLEQHLEAQQKTATSRHRSTVPFIACPADATKA